MGPCTIEIKKGYLFPDSLSCLSSKTTNVICYRAIALISEGCSSDKVTNAPFIVLRCATLDMGPPPFKIVKPMPSKRHIIVRDKLRDADCLPYGEKPIYDRRAVI